MTAWKAHLITGLMTLIVGSLAAAMWWVKEQDLSPRFARVDIGRVVAIRFAGASVVSCRSATAASRLPCQSIGSILEP